MKSLRNLPTFCLTLSLCNFLNAYAEKGTGGTVPRSSSKQQALAKAGESVLTIEDCIVNLASPTAHSYDELNNEIKLHPNNPKSYVYRGAGCISDGDPQKGIRDFRKALALDPNCSEAHIGISRVFQSMKKYRDAFFELDQAIKTGNKKNSAAALFESAFLHREVGDLANSLLLFDSLIKGEGLTNSQKAFAFFQRGEVQQRLKNDRAAIEDFNSALQLNPHLMIAHKMRAGSYLTLGKTKEALKDYTAVIDAGSQNSPNDLLGDLPSQLLIDTYNQRADLYRQLGKMDLATADRASSKKLQSQIFDVVPFRDR